MFCLPSHNDANALRKLYVLFPVWSSTVITLTLSHGNHQYQQHIVIPFVSLPELSVLLISEVSS